VSSLRTTVAIPPRHTVFMVLKRDDFPLNKKAKKKKKKKRTTATVIEI
jgi:hypothetical protein